MAELPWVARRVNSLTDSLEGRESTWQLDAHVSPELGQHLAHSLYSILLTDPPTRASLERVRRMAPGAIPLDPARLPTALDGDFGVLEALHEALQILDSRRNELPRSRAHPSGVDLVTLAQLIGELDQMLTEFGSAYELTRQPMGISWRVPPEVAEVVAKATQVVACGYPRAAARLHEAWDAAYKLSPDASDAIADCIRAVEAVAVPVVIPNQDDPQYWHVLGHLRSQGNHWRLVVEGRKEDDSIAPVVAMMERLGGAHLDRHEGLTPKVPTVEAAQAAVLLAATLVHWFGTGAVERR